MNLKALIEKRNALIADMKSLCDKATAETRAMTTEEQTDYDAKKAEVEALNKTIRSIEEQNALNLNSAKSENTATDKEQAETRANIRQYSLSVSVFSPQADAELYDKSQTAIENVGGIFTGTTDLSQFDVYPNRKILVMEFTLYEERT